MLKITGWKLLVLPEKPIEKVGSIEIPESYRARGTFGFACYGVIKQISDEIIKEVDTLEAMDIRVGSKVIFEKLSGALVKIDGEEYRIIMPEDIMAVVDEKMNIRLIGNRVMVKEKEAGNVKSSVIYIPETSKGLTQEGIVEIVGDGLQFEGLKKIEMYLKPGDSVFFGKQGVRQILVNNEIRLIMSQDNVFGIVEE